MRRAGFTLLELLIVIAILATMAAWIAPAAQRDGDQARVRAAVYLLATDLRALRQRARTSGQETVLALDPLRRSYAFGETARMLPQEAIIRFENRILAEAQPRIRFFADGSSTGGVIEVAFGSRTYRVRVSSPFGRITVEA